MIDLKELLIENSLYADDTQKADLIKNDPQLVKDAFWINTLGFLCIQKNYGSSVRNRKYFKQLDKAFIKNIGQDVHDMAAATKMAYDAGFLNDGFTMNFTKLLYLLKQTPDMKLNESLLRETFNKIVLSKIMPSPRIRPVILKYLDGNAELDDLMFPFFYHARAKKFSEDFQVFTRIFYKTMTQQAMAVRRDEKAGKDVSAHLAGPTAKKTTIVAVQTASTGNVVSSIAPSPNVAIAPKTTPVAPPAPTPIPQKKVYTEGNFNLFEEWDNPASDRNDLAYLFSIYLTSTYKWNYLDKATKDQAQKITDYIRVSYPTIDKLCSLTKGKSEFLSILDTDNSISNKNLSNLSDEAKLRIVSNFMKFCDRIGIECPFYGFYGTDGKPDPILQDIFNNVGNKVGVSPDTFINPGYTNATVAYERKKFYDYLSFHKNFFFLANIELIRMYQMYPKPYATFDEIAGNTLDSSNMDTYLPEVKALMVITAMSSKDPAIQKKGFAAIDSIIENDLQSVYSMIPKQIFEDRLSIKGLLDQKGPVIDKLKNWNSNSDYNHMKFSPLESDWIGKNSLQGALSDELKIKLAIHFTRYDTSEFYKMNGDWLKAEIASNKKLAVDYVNFIGDNYSVSVKNSTFLKEVLNSLFDAKELENYVNGIIQKIIDKKSNQTFAYYMGVRSTQEKISKIWNNVIENGIQNNTFNCNFEKLRKTYPDDLKVGDAVQIYSLNGGNLPETMKKMFWMLLNKDPVKDILGDYKAFVLIRNAFEFYQGYNTYKPAELFYFGNVITKYSASDIIDFATKGKNYSENDVATYSSSNSNSLLGDLSGGMQFTNYALKATKKVADAFDSLDGKVAEKAFEYCIGGNANDIGNDEEFFTFVKKAKAKLDPDAYNKIVKRTSYDTAYFRLVDSGLVEPYAEDFYVYSVSGIGEIVAKAKDQNGNIRAPEELIKLYRKFNKEGSGGLGDVYYRFEPMIDALALREISEKIMNDPRYSAKQREKIMDDLFSSVNMGRKGNDRKLNVAAKVIGDNAIKGSLLETNAKSLIPIAVKLTPESMLEIFKFNNFVVELPKELKVGKKKSIAQVYSESRGWKPSIPDLLVKRVEETATDLDKKTVEYSKYYNNKHGDIGVKFLESFEVTMDDTDEFKEFIAIHPTPTVIPAFHGTGSVAASMILRFGFKVVKKAIAGVNVAGKMLGDGIYFSNILSKTAQYLGDSGFTRNIGTVGYLLEMDAYIGKNPVNHRSAGVGQGDGIKSPEWCVFDARAQLKIRKAHKVMIVKGSAVRDLKKLHPEVLTEDRYFKGFQQFLTEERVNMKKSTTYIFYDGTVPDDNGKLIEFGEWMDEHPSNKFSLAPGQYGPEITIEHSNSNAPQFCHIPDSNEFITKDPEGLYTLFKTLNKK